jgi:hypothetical protein
LHGSSYPAGEKHKNIPRSLRIHRLDLDPSGSRLTTSNKEKFQKLGYFTPECAEFVVSEGHRGHSDIGLTPVFPTGLDCPLFDPPSKNEDLSAFDLL